MRLAGKNFGNQRARYWGVLSKLPLVVNVNSPSDVPSLAEPFFLTFNAHVEFRIAMTPEDLAGAGLDAIGKKWS